MGIARLRGERRPPFVEGARVPPLREVVVAEPAVRPGERLADLPGGNAVHAFGNELAVQAQGLRVRAIGAEKVAREQRRAPFARTSFALADALGHCPRSRRALARESA